MDIDECFFKVAKFKWWVSKPGMSTAEHFLDLASNMNNLLNLLEGTQKDARLRSLSERLQSLDKFVLLDDPLTKTRLRLHHFNNSSYDLLHNHKWPFCSKVLRGKLVQEIYESINSEEPQFISSIEKGDTYFLGPNLYHKLYAEKDTITLVLRGPDLLEAARWKNIVSGDAWEHFGGKSDNRKSDFDYETLASSVSKVYNLLGVV